METTTRLATVNGVQADFGCYISGHHGQYGIDALEGVAAMFGIDLTSMGETPTMLRRKAEAADNTNDAHWYWDGFYEAGQHIEHLLNSVTKDGLWAWDDGEFYLSPWEDDGIW